MKTLGDFPGIQRKWRSAQENKLCPWPASWTVEVYNEEGKPVQRAYYSNNLLVDSIKSFLKRELLKTKRIL